MVVVVVVVVSKYLSVKFAGVEFVLCQLSKTCFVATSKKYL